jgi:hypothetical protein
VSLWSVFLLNDITLLKFLLLFLHQTLLKCKKCPAIKSTNRLYTIKMRNTETSGVKATHFFRPLLQTHWFLFLLLLQIFLLWTPARISVVFKAEEGRRGCKIRLTTAFTRVRMPSAHILSQKMIGCPSRELAWCFTAALLSPWQKERERWQEISQTDNNRSENLLRVKSYLNGISGEKISRSDRRMEKCLAVSGQGKINEHKSYVRDYWQEEGNRYKNAKKEGKLNEKSPA